MQQKNFLLLKKLNIPQVSAVKVCFKVPCEVP